MRVTFLLALSVALATSTLSAQTDPGPRGGGGGRGAPPAPGQPPPPPPTGQPSSGQPLPSLSGAELQAFGAGRGKFAEVETPATGLGPRFNLDGCAGCHAQPALGGSSPTFNPQFPVAARLGAINHVPPFLQPNGPVRVVRFRRNPDGTPDGGVHNLFVIAGRADAPSACQITQPDFTDTSNLSFRIPTPTFGLGLIEALPDSTLRGNLAASAAARAALGIGGRFNTSGNDGTITRFGWKAQNKSLLMFSGEAYNVEEGVTNELFPQEREEDPACATNTLPENTNDLASGTLSDIEQFANFMRFLAPPVPTPATASIANGSVVFNAIGCNLCHTPSMVTGNAASPALAKQTANLYSDLAIHRMGQALADGITQGAAQGDEWRTAPLWGLGDRIFLLHDGRVQDLMQAIRLHDSAGSEAHSVIVNFQTLSASQIQDLLNFLRSL